MCQWEANSNPWAGYRWCFFPTPCISFNPQCGVRKSPLKLQVKQLEIDENVNRARLITLNLSLNNCTALAKALYG